MMFNMLPGINPEKWPIQMNLLLEKLEEMPPLAFFKESLDLHEDFFLKADKFIMEKVSLLNGKDPNNTEKNTVIFEELLTAAKIISLVHILSGNFLNLVLFPIIFFSSNL